MKERGHTFEKEKYRSIKHTTQVQYTPHIPSSLIYTGKARSMEAEEIQVFSFSSSSSSSVEEYHQANTSHLAVYERDRGLETSFALR